MEKVLVKNAADEQQVERAKERTLSKEEKDANDLRWVLNSKPGRRFMWRLLEECGVYKTSFTGNSATFFNEGMRNIGLKLINEINNNAPEAYLVMLKEAKGELDV